MLLVGLSNANWFVVGCKIQHEFPYSIPAPDEQKAKWLHLIFKDNVSATLPVSLFVLTNTSDHFSNYGQDKLASDTWSINIARYHSIRGILSLTPWERHVADGAS